MRRPSWFMVPLVSCFAFWTCWLFQKKLLLGRTVYLGADQIECPYILLCGKKEGKKKRNNRNRRKKKERKKGMMFRGISLALRISFTVKDLKFWFFFYLACSLIRDPWRTHSFAHDEQKWHVNLCVSGVRFILHWPWKELYVVNDRKWLVWCTCCKWDHMPASCFLKTSSDLFFMWMLAYKIFVSWGAGAIRLLLAVKRIVSCRLLSVKCILLDGVNVSPELSTSSWGLAYPYLRCW